MNKIFNPLENIDKYILICVGLLGALSLTMLESTVYEDGFVLARPVLIQAIAYVLGFGVLLFIQNLDYRFFIGLEKVLYVISILLLLTVYVPGLGQENYGSRAWINLGITTLQPSEFVKIPFVLIMAGYLSEHRDELTKFAGVFKAFLVAAPIIAIVLKEDLGSALVYIVMWIFMVFFAGIDYRLFFQCALACLVAVPIIYKFLDTYQKERIEAFLHPDNLEPVRQLSGLAVQGCDGAPAVCSAKDCFRARKRAWTSSQSSSRTSFFRSSWRSSVSSAARSPFWSTLSC